jgi:hypothetical protein
MLDGLGGQRREIDNCGVDVDPPARFALNFLFERPNMAGLEPPDANLAGYHRISEDHDSHCVPPAAHCQ